MNQESVQAVRHLLRRTRQWVSDETADDPFALARECDGRAVSGEEDRERRLAAVLGRWLRAAAALRRDPGSEESIDACATAAEADATPPGTGLLLGAMTVELLVTNGRRAQGVEQIERLLLLRTSDNVDTERIRRSIVLIALDTGVRSEVIPHLSKDALQLAIDAIGATRTTWGGIEGEMIYSQLVEQQRGR